MSLKAPTRCRRAPRSGGGEPPAVAQSHEGVVGHEGADIGVRGRGGIHHRPPPRVGRPDQPTRPARAACRVFPHGATRTPRRRPAPAPTQGRLRNQRGACSSPIAQPAPPAAPIGVSGRSESPALPRNEERVLARSWLIPPPVSAEPGRRRDDRIPRERSSRPPPSRRAQRRHLNHADRRAPALGAQLHSSRPAFEGAAVRGCAMPRRQSLSSGRHDYRIWVPSPERGAIASATARRWW
jgi:hypothetical protein